VKKKSTRTLTFWKNGFTVDEGQLRRFDDPRNREFLEDIEQGLAPREFEEEAGGEPVSINLVDRKTEEWQPPPEPKIKPFSGSGYSLSASSSASAPPPSAAPLAPSGKKSGLTVDPNQPTTSLQLRLHDGTRLVAKFNHTHTVQDIRNFVDAALPASSSMQYDLMTAFPNKVLTDNTASIQAAGLQGAVIMQKPR